MTLNKDNENHLKGDVNELRTRLITHHTTNSSQADSIWCFLPFDQKLHHQTYDLHFLTLANHPKKTGYSNKLNDISEISTKNGFNPSTLDERGEENTPETPVNVCCYPNFGWHAGHEQNPAEKDSNSGATGSSAEAPQNGNGAVQYNALDDFAYDDPDGFEMLWPDDLDSAHPFTRAAMLGDVEVVTSYSKRSTFDPSAKKCQHALLAACRAGHVEVVKTLLAAGVDVHSKDSKSNWQPIHIATYRDHVSIVEALAMHGEWRRGVALVRFKGVTCSLLHLAAHFGCVAVLRYLLSHTVRLGLHVEVRDAAHWTSLHHAAFEGKVQALTLLLQAGADVNAADPHGITALHVSAYRDHSNIVRQLLSRGANPKLIVASTSTARFSRNRPRLQFTDSVKTKDGSESKNNTLWKGSLESLLPNRRRCWSPSLPGTPAPNVTRDIGTIGRWKASQQNSNFSDVFYPTLYPVRSNSSFRRLRRTSSERGFERVEPIIKYHEGSTLLHWAASQGYDDLVADLLARGLKADALDRRSRTPLGRAVWAGHKNVIHMLAQEKVELAEGDKNWHCITDEEQGLTILRMLEETEICNLECCRSDGFTLLHLAAQKGYPNLMHRVLSLKVSPDLINNLGETALFVAIKCNQLACVQQLLKAGTKLRGVVDKKGASALHTAAKNGNVTVIDMLLTTSEDEAREIDINCADTMGYCPAYYAITASRYDIVQRFLEYSLTRKLHVNAKKDETLLQFFTERNNLGQYDNAVVRVLECEKFLHFNKSSAEICIRSQLGTTESSSKARVQLQQMYESTKAQRHCWNFWFFLSCFLLPSIFYYLDVYTDILLAFEYYEDYYGDLIYPTNDSKTCTNETLEPTIRLNSETNITIEETFWAIFVDLTASQHKINFVLTVFFILLPMSLLSMWNLYIHLTQPDILPLFRDLPRFLRALLYTLVFITPLAPVIAYLENTYAQMKHMNVTARSLQEADSKSFNAFSGYGNSKTFHHHLRDKMIRKYYELKHVAQMRVAITNVMEATLESAFQLILQLYIVGTQYCDLTKVGEVTLRSMFTFSTEWKSTRLTKQVFSVLISLVSLTWSFTSYHRFSKLGGLTILSALPLLFAIFFQVVSRAIACTIFTLSYKWKIFVVLGIHFVIVLIFKLKLEERSQAPTRSYTCCYCMVSIFRPYFYVFLGTIASTLVYFRLERPSYVKKQLSRRHSTVIIQVLFMVLAFVENFVLLSMGIVGLQESQYDPTFKTVSCVLCTLSYLIGIVLHGVYYGCFGHPWVDINGPTLTRDKDDGTLVLSYYREGVVNKWFMQSCCRISHQCHPPDDLCMPSQLVQMRMNGAIRQVKNI